MGDTTSDSGKKKKKASSRKKAADAFVKAVSESTRGVVDEDDVCAVVYEAHTRNMPMIQRGLAAAKENTAIGTVLGVTETYNHCYAGYRIVGHVYDGVQWLTKGIFGS